jgi:DNA-directed RNA polymerase subunit RPC12/RpoP
MATGVTHICDNCDFEFRSFHRMRHESMLKEEGASTYFCIACMEKVNIFSDEEKKCPKCGKDQLVGHNVNKCPKCQTGNLYRDTYSEVSF